MSINKELIKELKKQGQTIKPILFIGKNEITDTVYEAILLALKARELIDSGFRIGRDMSGTMSQTLILAFIGTSLTAMLVLRSYGVHFDQFLSSDYMAIEILHGIIGGLSVIISIPVTVFLSTWFLCKHKTSH